MVTRRGFLSGAWARLPRTEARIASHCLATRGIVCQSCAEACATELIRFRLAPGGVSRPIIAVDGCAGCVPACPVGAISMRPSTTILECVAT